MTPKEKVNELINKFNPCCKGTLPQSILENSKECAIIAVEEIIASQPHTVSAIGFGSAQVTNPDIEFWNEVLNELKARQ
jgi:hypothetical protein